jgi:hypothetical protein
MGRMGNLLPMRWLDYDFFPSSEACPELAEWARFCFGLVMCRAISKMVPNRLSFGDRFDQPGWFQNSR